MGYVAIGAFVIAVIAALVRAGMKRLQGLDPKDYDLF